MLKIFAAFIISFIVCFKTSAQNADIDLLKNINVGRNTNLDHTFEGISKSVYPVSLTLPIGLLGVGFIKKDKDLQRKGLTATVSLVVSFGTTYVLKRVIKRDRPYAKYPFLQPAILETDPSFPSGHTTGAFTTATSLTLAYPKWYVAVPAYAWASTVAYSRMHLGVHYPTDILAGAIIGSGSAWLSHKANRWLQRKSKKN
jgi:membrane-associated phospholipid phosphatase